VAIHWIKSVNHLHTDGDFALVAKALRLYRHLCQFKVVSDSSWFAIYLVTAHCTLRRRRNIFLSLFFSQTENEKKPSTKNMWWIHFDVISSIEQFVLFLAVLLWSIHTVVNHAAYLFVSQSSLVSSTRSLLMIVCGSELGSQNIKAFYNTPNSFLTPLSLSLSSVTMILSDCTASSNEYSLIPL